MTITFENHNDVIVYALENTIAYTRRTQQIFVAHCVWWLASVIELEQGLINYINNLWERSEISLEEVKESSEGPAALVQEEKLFLPVATDQQARGKSTVPRDIQEGSRIIDET